MQGLQPQEKEIHFTGSITRKIRNSAKERCERIVQNQSFKRIFAGISLGSFSRYIMQANAPALIVSVFLFAYKESEVNAHYSEDNITKRNSWMNWVNERTVVYDNSIVDITKNLADVTQALTDNTKLTEEIFIQSSRDRIIAFSTKVADENALVSMEEFNRIFKVYNDYANYLHDHNLTNGEVEIAHRIIEESYELRLKTRSFTEYIRGYITGE